MQNWHHYIVSDHYAIISYVHVIFATWIDKSVLQIDVHFSPLHAIPPVKIKHGQIALFAIRFILDGSRRAMLLYEEHCRGSFR